MNPPVYDAILKGFVCVQRRVQEAPSKGNNASKRKDISYELKTEKIKQEFRSFVSSATARHEISREQVKTIIGLKRKKQQKPTSRQIVSKIEAKFSSHSRAYRCSRLNLFTQLCRNAVDNTFTVSSIRRGKATSCLSLSAPGNHALKLDLSRLTPGVVSFSKFRRWLQHSFTARLYSTGSVDGIDFIKAISPLKLWKLQCLCGLLLEESIYFPYETALIARYYDAATLTKQTHATNDYSCCLNRYPYPSGNCLLVTCHIECNDEDNKISSSCRAELDEEILRERRDISNLTESSRRETQRQLSDWKRLKANILNSSQYANDERVLDTLNDNLDKLIQDLLLLSEGPLADFGFTRIQSCYVLDLKSESILYSTSCSSTFPSPFFGGISADFIRKTLNKEEYFKQYFVADESDQGKVVFDLCSNVSGELVRMPFHNPQICKRKTRSQKVCPRCGQGGYLSGSIHTPLDYDLGDCRRKVFDACKDIPKHFLKDHGVNIREQYQMHVLGVNGLHNSLNVAEKFIWILA